MKASGHVLVMGLAVFCLVLSGWVGSAMGEETTRTVFDFTQGAQGWRPLNHVADFAAVPDGLSFRSTGEDPYIACPMADLPSGNKLDLTIRMKSNADTNGEVFFGKDFKPLNSVRFMIKPDGAWHEYSMILPAQEPDTPLRLDLATSEGLLTVAWIKVRELIPLMSADFPKPAPVVSGPGDLTIQSGALTIAHNPAAWDAYKVTVDGKDMACGHTDARLGYMHNGQPLYVDLADAKTAAVLESGALVVSATAVDAQGGTWTLTRRFAPIAGQDAAISMETSIAVDQDRDVFHLPFLTLFPGLGSYGERKTQALLPGVEYLEDEPSSSEADLEGPQANRRMVDDYRLCYPMMALCHEGRYLGLVWNRADHPGALFDSPDRVFNSGAQVWGLWKPGVGDERLESDLNVYKTFPLKAGQPATLTASLISGAGETILPAVKHYIALRGMPDLPDYADGFDGAVKSLAVGWLDSAGHQDGKWRHAVFGSLFPPQPASDAPVYMQWLASQTQDPALASRLRQGAARGLEQIPTPWFMGTISHVKRPFQPLILGHGAMFAQGLTEEATKMLDAFDPDGIARYHPQPGKTDYGRTHYTDHANGFTAVPLSVILQAAAFTGDPTLIEKGLALLDKFTVAYANGVPRGAQTWEMPLHTPDILGSARILECYNLGYLLTGKQEYLEQARYWAWTGLTMVYLDQPVAGKVGTYATIGVIGATAWAAPNWIGQPVQWCGLVYRSALEDLAAMDEQEGAFWANVARGITLTGLNMTFPLTDAKRQGLLPDYFLLKAQVSDGPAISPGTVQANLAQVYGKPSLYALRRLAGGVLIHAPGTVTIPNAGDSSVSRATIDAWSPEPYWVRLVRVPANARFTWTGPGGVLSQQCAAANKAWDIQLQGDGELTVVMP